MMQNLTIACFGPVFLTLHLFTSPAITDSSALIAPLTDVISLPFSILFGSLIPNVVLGLRSPSVVSFATQQLAIAIWTPFPVWVALFQKIFCSVGPKITSIFFRRLAGARPSAMPSEYAIDEKREAKPLLLTPAVRRQEADIYLQKVRPVYTILAFISFILHISTGAFVLITVLFPMMFSSSPAYTTAFAPGHLLFPAFAGHGSRVETIGQGVLVFMQWDMWIGFSAMAIWAAVLNHTVLVGPGRKNLGWGATVQLWTKVLGVMTILGPGAGVVALIWERDELMLNGKEEEEEAEKRLLGRR